MSNLNANVLSSQDNSGEIDASELLVLLRDIMKRMNLVRNLVRELNKRRQPQQQGERNQTKLKV